MRILITGHEGFIGKNVKSHLLSLGHEVVGWEWESDTLLNLENYDWCIHLGAISSTTYSDVEQIMKQNLDFSIHLLGLCQFFGTNFQYASSASVYGPTTHFKEEGPLLPQSPYAWSKYLFDRFVNLHMDDFEIIVQGFRYFNVYGEGENHKGDQASPISKFTKEAKENGKFNLFDNSENYLRDFVCVRDVALLHQKMLDTKASGIWNVGTGSPRSFATVADCIAKKYNAEINIVSMPENLKGQYQEYTCANLEKLNSIVDMSWTSVEDYINEPR